MKELVYLSDVVILKLCEDTFKGCGMCLKVCPLRLGRVQVALQG